MVAKLFKSWMPPFWLGAYDTLDDSGIFSFCEGLGLDNKSHVEYLVEFFQVKFDIFHIFYHHFLEFYKLHF
jgi:hypothetical protein